MDLKYWNLRDWASVVMVESFSINSLSNNWSHRILGLNFRSICHSQGYTVIHLFTTTGNWGLIQNQRHSLSIIANKENYFNSVLHICLRPSKVACIFGRLVQFHSLCQIFYSIYKLLSSFFYLPVFLFHSALSPALRFETNINWGECWLKNWGDWLRTLCQKPCLHVRSCLLKL